MSTASVDFSELRTIFAVDITEMEESIVMTEEGVATLARVLEVLEVHVVQRKIDVDS